MVTQELDREAEENGGAAHEPFETLRQVAKAVAAAAAVGAAVGAARAFTSRDSGEEDGDDEDEQREPQEAQAQLPEHDEERDHEEEEDDEPDQAAEASQPESEATAEQPEPELEPQPSAEHHEPEPDPEQVEQRENGSEPMQGGTLDETADIVRRAREQFQALQSREPESISSLERTDGGWTATFEVVELERIPSSMDVLASYEVALDDQKNMVRYSRTRRYYRAQSDREVGS